MKESERRRVKVALRATGAAADVASLHQKDAAILSDPHLGRASQCAALNTKLLAFGTSPRPPQDNPAVHSLRPIAPTKSSIQQSPPYSLPYCP